MNIFEGSMAEDIDEYRYNYVTKRHSSAERNVNISALLQL